jgi:hypothetical protein
VHPIILTYTARIDDVREIIFAVGENEIGVRHSVVAVGGFRFVARMLFSDALVIGGMVSHEEIATSSSIGFYVYSPPREKRKEELVAAEGSVNFEGLQRFLSCVHTLMDEKRLLRHLYLARKGP